VGNDSVPSTYSTARGGQGKENAKGEKIKKGIISFFCSPGKHYSVLTWGRGLVWGGEKKPIERKTSSNVVLSETDKRGQKGKKGGGGQEEPYLGYSDKGRKGHTSGSLVVGVELRTVEVNAVCKGGTGREKGGWGKREGT